MVWFHFSVLEMTSPTPDLPLCELSFHGHWTPLNQIFYSQCIQDSDEESSFYSQRKKWKRKRHHGENEEVYKDYIVYEFASSSESEVSVSDEFNTADNYEVVTKKKKNEKSKKALKKNSKPKVVAKKKKNQKSKRNIKRRISPSVEPNINLMDECDDPQNEKQERINDERPCSEPEVNMSDELNSSIKQMEIVGIDDDKSCSEPEVHLSDEVNSEDGQEGRSGIDDDKCCSETEVCMSDEINSADEQEKSVHCKQSAVKYEKNTTDKNESSDDLESDSNTSDDDYVLSDSSYNKKNNLHHNQPAAKHKEYTTDENESSDNSEILSNSSDDYDLSDSSDDYEVAKRKKKNQKSKKALKKNSKPKGIQLSEYEKMVQKNRDEKIDFLKSLKILEAKEDFKEALEARKPKTDKNKRKIFQNLENGLMREVDKRTKTNENKDIGKICRRSPRQKNFREERKENFSSFQSYNELHTVKSFEETLKKGYKYHDFISEDNVSECKISQIPDNDYVSRFQKMTLQEHQSVSSGYISSMAIHESQEKIIICTGNGRGEIIFWHVNSDYDCSAFQLHLQRVSCLKFNPCSPNVLISSSVDGTMYHGDFQREVFYQIFKAECCNHFDFFSPTSYLVAHGIKYISIVDIRSNRKTLEKRHKCNEDAVKTVSFHPVNKNYFISAHKKGSVRLWDLRKLQNEPVIEVYCEGEKLISSSFSPVTGNSVLTTMSDSICLLDSSSLLKKFTLEKSIEHDNFHSGWTPFQATWLPNTDDTFVVGSRLNPRRIEIFDDKLCNIFNFTDKHFNSLATVNAFHSSLPLLASATMKHIFIFSESE